MSAIHAMRSRAPRSGFVVIGLIAILVIPVGCGGSSASTATGPTTTNPKAAQRQRDMADFMKTQKPK